LSLGGFKFPLPYLENLELAQAIYNKQIPDTNLSIIHQLENSSAIEWFQNLHAKDRRGRSLAYLNSRSFHGLYIQTNFTTTTTT